ncbi:TetR/AcrR family transcriptional regulator [Simplicispira hankyongi]|uniref:TetR/AcrR family transcriptional regulator n=1 Tax=Simplicispira hankyongi TaxID=2315688 RepID=A0A398CHF9_9BURK|nr:TetR/AcrR family transcriptional regulator [Simplicispira hankyongi]
MTALGLFQSGAQLTSGNGFATLLTSQSVIYTLSTRPAPLPAEPPHDDTLGAALGGAARRERRKQARPGELLDAALDLFVEKGFTATRVEEVAARAGVSKGTLFLYFPSKEELFKAVVRESIVGRFDEWSAQIDQFPGSTGEMLRACYQAWWERIGNTRASGITKLMLCEAGNFPEIAQFYQHEVIEPAQQLIRRVLARGVASGEFRAVDPVYAVHAIIAPLMFLMLTKHSMGACVPNAADFDPQTFIDHQIDGLLYGLCVRPALAVSASPLPSHP